jgi:hypothetical protein
MRGDLRVDTIEVRQDVREPVPSTRDEYLWVNQQKVILDIAEKDPCVIVGRCADFILRERDDCLKVFIHAGIKERIERIKTITAGNRYIIPKNCWRKKIRGGRFTINILPAWNGVCRRIITFLLTGEYSALTGAWTPSPAW